MPGVAPGRGAVSSARGDGGAAGASLFEGALAGGPSLLDLWQQSDDELRTLLKGSPMKRAGVMRLRRNLAIALGNSGAAAAVVALEANDAPTCHDPLVAEHVAWAEDRLRR